VPQGVVVTDALARHPSRKAARLAPIDRIVALASLILLLPLVISIAVAIVADSGFPVFFSQERLGLQGRRFWMLKFRKFHPDIGGDTRPLTLADDPRFTRVGRFLAKTKLDEVPQLWNVIRGDMAVVGPRPEVPEFEACFAGPLQQLLDYRPGIFGPSQSAFRSEAVLFTPDRHPQEFYRQVLFPAKAALDLAYYPTRTVFGDIRWVLRGILAVCRPGHAMPVGLARSPGAPAPTVAKAASKAAHNTNFGT
jgi:lipopolysaccharide/colanic/teichoic acid biosynthesis glycosyltransferase